MVGGGGRRRAGRGRTFGGRRRRRDATGGVAQLRWRRLSDEDRYRGSRGDRPGAREATRGPTPAVVAHRRTPDQPDADRRLHPRQAQGQGDGEGERGQHARGGAKDARDGDVLVLREEGVQRQASAELDGAEEHGHAAAREGERAGVRQREEGGEARDGQGGGDDEAGAVREMRRRLVRPHRQTSPKRRQNVAKTSPKPND